MEIKIDPKKLVLLPIGELKPNPKNRNKHPREQIERLKKLIQYQGFRQPIIVSNRSGLMVVGHGRLEAAKELGMTHVPVIFQDFESEEQEYAFSISDNAVASWSELDLSGINMDIPDLGPDFDLELLGMKDFELVPPETVPGCDEDEVPEKVEPKAKRGDLYVLGNHRLMCGDSTSIDDVERLMGAEKADMVFTDPPYGVSYEQGKYTGASVKNKFSPIANDEKRGDELRCFIRDVFTNAWAASNEPAVIYSWSPPLLEGAEILAGLVESNWHIQSQLIWDKKRLILGRADYQWRHEICWYGYKGQNHFWCGDRDQTSVWEQKRDSNYDHPTQKPVELAERAMNNSSKNGDAVLDLFLGSGSTLVACEKTNRRCFGMEIDPHYIDVIIARWERFSGKKAELISS